MFSKRTSPQGAVADKQQRPDVCKAECDKALKLNPKYIKAALKRANYYIAVKQYDKAKRDCKRILDHDPANIECKSVITLTREASFTLLCLQKSVRRGEKVRLLRDTRCYGVRHY